MPVSSRLEEQLAQLAPLDSAASLTAEQVHLLAGAISSNQSLLIRRAAAIIARHTITDLTPDLARCFLTLLGKPAKADKGCLAKTALVEALNSLQSMDETPFLRGIHFIQHEPGFGQTIDTAALVRAQCAIGLARISHPRAAHEILPLLVDAEPQARAAAVRALAYLGGDAGDLLLRLKALVGDEHPAVVGECLSALTKMAPRAALDFVAPFLDSPNLAIVEEAAMALAESQEPQAADILCRCRTSQPDHTFRERMLMPIAMTRCDQAMEHLFAVIVDEPLDSALAAMKAMAMHRHDPRWSAKAKDAATLREDPAVTQQYEKDFPPP